MAGAEEGRQLRDQFAVMTQKQVAEWLQVRPRQIERLGIPRLDLGHKTKRYLKHDVLAWLETQRQASSRSDRSAARLTESE